jgi:hypothetical protein
MKEGARIKTVLCMSITFVACLTHARARWLSGSNRVRLSRKGAWKGLWKGVLVSTKSILAANAKNKGCQLDMNQPDSQ